MRKPLLALLLVNTLLVQPLSALALDVRPEFNPSILIPDASFNDTQTFGGPEGIQRFLESKNSVLANTSPDFLAKLNEPNDVAVKQALGDPEPDAGRLRTAAELIWDVSRQSGINPQVILVTLQKEQGLISNQIDATRIQKALNHAMGFDCPDASGCGNLFPGFYYQLFGNVDTEGNRYLGAARSLMKSFSTPEGRGPQIGGVVSKVGDTIPIDNTVGDYDGISRQQPVTIGNRATAALYRYTPHVFNGNYNFWKFFTSWFKYANGTLLISSVDGTTYIIQNGTKERVPAFVAAARGLNLATAIRVSPTELDSYPLGATYTPADNTIANANGQFYVFIDGVMHPATNFVITQRKLDPAKSLPLQSTEVALFSQGSQLTPADGTVLHGQRDPKVYLVDKGILKIFSPLTIKQYNVAKKVELVPDDEIALYPKQGYVIPLEGTLIQAPVGNDVYVIGEGRRLPVTSKLFQNLEYRTKDVIRLASDAEIASIPVGPPVTPKEGTYFAISDSPELFLFKGGAKHPIYPFIAKQRGIKADYSFDASIVSGWPEGIAIAPSERTLVKSDDSPAVYVVTGGQLHPLTTDLVKNLGLNLKNVVTLPAVQVDALPKGGYATPSENTYFSVSGSHDFYLFKNGVKQPIYPFVATQRGMSPDYVFSKDMSDAWPVGAPLMPREGTLLKSPGDTTIYLVSQGKLHSLSTKAFQRRGYTQKQIKTIPRAERDRYPKGEAIVK